jgi:hypothetical protein
MKFEDGTMKKLAGFPEAYSFRKAYVEGPRKMQEVGFLPETRLLWYNGGIFYGE